MTKQAIIERTINAINKLPADKAEEISDFADFISKRYEEFTLAEDVQGLASGQSFDFLHDEDDLYTENDIKGPYAKG